MSLRLSMSCLLSLISLDATHVLIWSLSRWRGQWQDGQAALGQPGPQLSSPRLPGTQQSTLPVPAALRTQSPGPQPTHLKLLNLLL